MNLKNDSVEKSEIKVYDKYIGILSDLKNRDLTQNQIQSIESELETLNLNAESDNRKKYLKQKLSEFQKFLKDKFDLVSDGFYAGTGIVLGSIFSMLYLSVLGTYSLLTRIIRGLILGAVLGGIRDLEAYKQGRILITIMDENTSYNNIQKLCLNQS